MRTAVLILMLATGLMISQNPCIAFSARIQSKRDPMEERFLQLMRRTVSELPFSNLEECARLFSVTLPGVRQPGSNEILKVYESKGRDDDPLIAKVELRVNFKKDPKKQLLNVHLKRALRLSNSAFDLLLGVHGKEMGFSSSDRIDAGTYVTYKLKSGEIRVWFSGLDYNSVTGFSADTFEKK